MNNAHIHLKNRLLPILVCAAFGMYLFETYQGWFVLFWAWIQLISATRG